MDNSPAAQDRRSGRRGAASLWTFTAPAVGALLSGFAAAEVFGAAPGQRSDGFLLPLLGALALTAGGWSLLRLLQLLGEDPRVGSERAGAARARASSAELHRIWLLGVAGSLGLMGLLGLWSLADGARSGLEPGWPLLLGGGALAGAAQLLCARVEARAARSEERRERVRHEEHVRRLEDPLGRIRQAAQREQERAASAQSTASAPPDEERTPAEPGGEVTGASSDSRPGSDPSSAGTR